MHGLNFLFIAFMDLLDLQQVRVSEQFCRCALRDNSTFFHDDNLVSQVDKIHCVRHQNPRPVLQYALKHLFVDLLACLSVKS